MATDKIRCNEDERDFFALVTNHYAQKEIRKDILVLKVLSICAPTSGEDWQSKENVLRELVPVKLEVIVYIEVVNFALDDEENSGVNIRQDY